jgi:hypothetical protein
LIIIATVSWTPARADSIHAFLTSSTVKPVVAIVIIAAFTAGIALTINAILTNIANTSTIPAVLAVPIQVRANTATVRVAQHAPAPAIGAVGVLDAGIATLAAVAVVVLKVYALAVAGSQAVFGTMVDFVVGAAGCCGDKHRDAAGGNQASPRHHLLHITREYFS